MIISSINFPKSVSFLSHLTRVHRNPATPCTGDGVTDLHDSLTSLTVGCAGVCTALFFI